MSKLLRPVIQRQHRDCELAIDLCCGAGGMSMGLWQAGFEVVGVDINPQPNYPFQFVQADALLIDPSWLAETANVVSLAPPCQLYSQLRSLSGYDYPDLIGPLRDIALSSGLPYILENVMGAAPNLVNPQMLCGSYFGLRVRRHRLIESNVQVCGTTCDHEWQDYLPCYKVKVGYERDRRGYKETGVMPVYGLNSINRLVSEDDLLQASVAMGIHWMTKPELNEAIPPAYGRHIGKQLLAYLWNTRNQDRSA